MAAAAAAAAASAAGGGDHTSSSSSPPMMRLIDHPHSSPAHSLVSSSSDGPPTPTDLLARWQRDSSLNADEEEAVHAFLGVVNPWRQNRSYEPLPWNSAVKFLMARKFSVGRALSLYQQHELMRIREGLTMFDPSSAPLKEELQTQKFTILPTKDANGATLALFSAHKHDPGISSHRTTLQGVVYQLDVAMEDAATQRGGLVFIYNMSGSKYSNFDYDLSQKMLTLLKGAYPARLKKVLIVTAPLWFKAPFKVLRLFVREKLRDRVFTVSVPQLQLHVPPDSVPREIGGSLVFDHRLWLEKCAEVARSKDGELVTLSSSQPTSPAEHKRRQNPTLEQLETLPVTTASGSTRPVSRSSSHRLTPNGLSKLVIEPNPPPQPPEDEDSMRMANGEDGDNVVVTREGLVKSNSSGLSDEENPIGNDNDDAGMILTEFIEHVRVKGRRGLYEEYTEIKNRPPLGTFNHSRAYENQLKNRYTDVLCYDHSRVRLLHGGEGDYINANYVDGYKQSKAFISSQGPLPKTFPDFWQMVWEQQVLVIVMTTKTVERHRTKCGQYWPEDCGASVAAGQYEVHSEEMENCEDFVVTHLTVRKRKLGARHKNGDLLGDGYEERDGARVEDDDGDDEEPPRRVCHFQFVSWPDYGVPESALSMLNFLQRVREKQSEMLSRDLGDSWTGHPLGPPIVVHCSAGIGRTGTFATLDIAIRKYEDVGRVDIQTTVERIRGQRAFSIQMPDQYVFCHLAFLEFALMKEYVEEVDLTGFDDDCDSE